VLGRFLEWSIVTPDIGASLAFYRKLGFSEAEVGEAWTHPYAVVTDGRIHLGLHQQPSFAASATFVKPQLLKHLRSLEELGLDFEFRHLANDRFNEVGWLDPSGHLIRLVEARTFSPLERPTAADSLCGYFSEVALPAASLERAKLHWERFGFVGLDDLEATLPHVSCTSDTVDIGLYEPAHLPEPTLIFEVDDFAAAAARLDEAGIIPRGRLPAPLNRRSAAMLKAPEGTALLLAERRD